MELMDRFSLENKIVIITGGAGLLGRQHAEAVLEAYGIPVLLDISANGLLAAKECLIKKRNNATVETFVVDITSKDSLLKIKDKLIEIYGHIDALINNAANNPKMETPTDNMGANQFENFSLDIWNKDISVGLTGALLCAQVFGSQMAIQNKGVIINISSDLGIIAPDQRIYRREGIDDNKQTVKPVTYSVVKHGLIGLTKYLATYYAEKGIRVNSLCPAGVFNGQDDVFVEKLTNLVPMGRMANKDEYRGTIIYLLSDASSYMTGSTVIVDGGRTCW